MSEFEDEFNALKAKGNDFFVKNDFANAEQTYTEALNKFDQNHVILLTNRSAARLGLGDFEAALVDATQAINLDSKWTKGYFRKATALEKLERPREAFETWKDAEANCDASAWLSKQVQAATNEWKKSFRKLQVTSDEDFISTRYKVLVDPREKLSTLAHFWNDSTLEERLGHFRFLITLIGGQGDVSSYNKSITEDFMVPMPLHNYEDLPRSNIAPWCDYFKNLSPKSKTGLLEKMWPTLTDVEQNAVIVDLRVFISEAIIATNASMLMKARSLGHSEGEEQSHNKEEEEGHSEEQGDKLNTEAVEGDGVAESSINKNKEEERTSTVAAAAQTEGEREKGQNTVATEEGPLKKIDNVEA